jgi:hypothetical protein
MNSCPAYANYLPIIINITIMIKKNSSALSMFKHYIFAAENCSIH